MTAESVVHYTATNEAKPSLFEIIAQKSLNTTLFPAFHKIAEFLALCFPTKCHHIPKYSDELFLVLKGLLEYNYLKKKDACFSEYFYGLKRVSVTDNQNLKTFQRWSSLLISVIVPYFIRKVENKIEQFKLETLDGSCKTEFERQCKKSTVTIYSTGQMFWNTWTFVQYLRYVCNKTDIQVPELFFLRLKLVYAEQIFDASNFWFSLFHGKLSASEMITGIFHNSLSTALEISAFLLQFLKVWNNENVNYSLTNLPKVPPPVLDQKAEIYKGKCPICLQKQKIPTVLPVSGYVFCFSCILKYLRDTPKCPVTNLPANPGDIIRIYG